MANKKKSTVLLKSYSSIWHVEKKIKEIAGQQVNIPLITLMYFGVCACIDWFLYKTFFFIRAIPLIFHIAFVLGVPVLLKKVKLEGRSPIKFFYDLALHYISPKEYYSFQDTKGEDLKIKTRIPYREIYRRK